MASEQAQFGGNVTLTDNGSESRTRAAL